ncbi:MAG: 3'(2'),5'-bisphosphate nucleotidase CysQ [Planctomycetota bacterium]
MSVTPDLESVTAIAHAAGQRIAEIYATHTGAHQTKADDSPLTTADLASHTLICKQLDTLDPAIPVLSEESAAIPHAQRVDWQRFWLVDPLDGTKEFLKRNGEFTVNIALIDHGMPVLGVVHAPMLARSYIGGPDGARRVDGVGSAASARSIHVRAHRPGEPWQVVASRSHRNAETEAYLAGLGAHECVAMGSSLKLCLVAEGAAHIYPRLGPTMEWDTAAAHAVVRAAGGSVHDLDGRELRYNKPDLHNPHFIVEPR